MALRGRIARLEQRHHVGAAPAVLRLSGWADVNPETGEGRKVLLLDAEATGRVRYSRPADAFDLQSWLTAMATLEDPDRKTTARLIVRLVGRSDVELQCAQCGFTLVQPTRTAIAEQCPNPRCGRRWRRYD